MEHPSQSRSLADVEAADTTLKEFSRNPAWCILDYLMESRELTGMGVPSTEINLDSFTTAAGVCDEEVLFGTASSYDVYAKDEYLDYDQGSDYSITQTDDVDDELLIKAPNGVRFCPLKTGDTVKFPVGSTPPYGLLEDQDYYIRVTRWESKHEYYMKPNTRGVVVVPKTGETETITEYVP